IFGGGAAHRGEQLPVDGRLHLEARPGGIRPPSANRKPRRLQVDVQSPEGISRPVAGVAAGTAAGASVLGAAVLSVVGDVLTHESDFPFAPACSAPAYALPNRFSRNCASGTCSWRTNPLLTASLPEACRSTTAVMPAAVVIWMALARSPRNAPW